MPLSELRLIDLTTRMFTEPIFELDPTLLIAARKDDLDRKEELLAKVNTNKIVLSSNGKFAELLVSLGVDPPKKISPAWRKKNPEEDPGEEPIGLVDKGNKAWSYAFGKTDEGFKQMLESDDAVLSALAEARAGVKSNITETRIQRLIGIASRGKLPVYLKAWGAHTGRYGAGDKCLAANTKIMVFSNNKVFKKNIQDVMLDDLVWDGVDFVKHEGVIYKGVRRVIAYDGVVATPDHKAWVKGISSPVCLFKAAKRNYALLVAEQPDNRALDRAGRYRGNYFEQTENTLSMRLWDRIYGAYIRLKKWWYNTM
jgi:hypothetical protein